MRIEVTGDERAVLLKDLEDGFATTQDAYGLNGLEWDRYDPANGHDIAILVRAHDDLAHHRPPWTLKGSRDDLEELMTALRRGASSVLERFPDMNRAATEQTDARLDVMAVCDSVLARLRAASED